jgi:alpha-beta hydrolase superfamily lysophospholipase
MSTGWFLDSALRSSGLDALWPDSLPAFLEIGFKLNDIRRLSSQLPNLRALSSHWAQIASRHQAIAERAYRSGQNTTAGEAYYRASISYGFAQWVIKDDQSSVKHRYQTSCIQAYTRAINLLNLRSERVEIPFDDKLIYGILHLPRKPIAAPVVLAILGMDMVKEYFPIPHRNIFTDRGMGVLVIDGPGQGETNLGGLKLSSHNFEEVGNAVLDYLGSRPEVDASRIGAFAIGTGVYFCLQIAAQNDRIRAISGFEGGVLYDKISFAARAQPNFKQNLMSMMGIRDENTFQQRVAPMTLAGREHNIRAPVCLVQGEFDELADVSDALRFYQSCSGPVHLVIYKGEGHVLGGVFPEALSAAVDWMADRLERLDRTKLSSKIIEIFPRSESRPIESIHE